MDGTSGFAHSGSRRHSIATVTLGGTLGEKLAAAAAAGFDGIELFEPDLIAAPLVPDEVRRRLADLGLSLELYQPLRDVEANQPEQFHRKLRAVQAKFDFMERLGARMALLWLEDRVSSVQAAHRAGTVPERIQGACSSRSSTGSRATRTTAPETPSSA